MNVTISKLGAVLFVIFLAIISDLTGYRWANMLCCVFIGSSIGYFLGKMYGESERKKPPAKFSPKNRISKYYDTNAN